MAALPWPRRPRPGSIPPLTDSQVAQLRRSVADGESADLRGAFFANSGTPRPQPERPDPPDPPASTGRPLWRSPHHP